MEREKLIETFDALRPKQKIKASIRAVMGMSSAMTGTPTEYIVGRRTKSKSTENLHLLNADGSAMHPIRKVTLYKRRDCEGTEFVSVAIGDMAATLLSIELV